MARASIWQQPFDRDATFIVHKPFMVSGQNFRPGDVFDSALVTTRRLRCMYDMRKLRMAPAQDPMASPIAGPAPQPREANDDFESQGMRVPDGMTAKHTGGGKYRVIFQGRIISEAIAKEDVPAKIAELAREHGSVAA